MADTEPKIHAPAVKVAGEIAEERSRQIDGEGWSLKHDDEHWDGSIAAAAAVYALFGTRCSANLEPPLPVRLCPWRPDWFKPTNRRRNLIKAGALIVAEIERLDRAAEREQAEG